MTTRIEVAVILAAGRGQRLGPAGVEKPKGFMQFGSKPIIQESVEKLLDVGITRIILVVGHLASYYETFAAQYPGVIELVYNPDFASSGSMNSLFRARELINQDFLLLESDLVYERRALPAVLAAGGETVLLVSGATGSNDEVYVEVQGTQLHNLSKQRAQLQGEVIGELVGITRIALACFGPMCRYAESVFKETLLLEYEQALVAAARDVPVNCHLIDDLQWSEIDTEEHRTRVIERVYPRIQQSDEANQAERGL
jgi:2-aminoethylphosphonate-pyruvate transaminase